MSQQPIRPPVSKRSPSPLPHPGDALSNGAKSIPSGCYLLLYTPQQEFVGLQGTCRIDRSTGHTMVSGDLYQRQFDVDAMMLAPPPDPSEGIPVFGIEDHRFYLRVTRYAESGEGFTMTFDAHRFSPVSVMLMDGTETQWPAEGPFTAELRPVEDRSDGKAGGARFGGEVRNAAGAIIGSLSMELVSPFLRKATIEIDTVPASPLPLSNSAGLSWREVFESVGWDLTVVEGDRDVPEPYDHTWNMAEGHAALLKAREKVDLNSEWRYHIIAVQLLEGDEGQFGVMYDRGAVNDNNAPREGLLVASHWRFPENEPRWGLVRGRLTSETDTYFRTTIHELGHAMGLEHVSRSRTFMESTADIAAASLLTPETPFPANVVWAFSVEDQHRLRHWSDLIVRPGGAGFATGDQSPLNAMPSPHFRLEIGAANASVPLGAPVRIEVSANNLASAPAVGPGSLALESPGIRGWVIDPSGKTRMFAPFAVSEDGLPTHEYAEGERIEGSITLLGGVDGNLFPTAGDYKVIVEVQWNAQSITQSALAETSVTVTPAQDEAHARIASRLLATPSMPVMLAIGGDHLPDALEALNAALGDPVLYPHWAFVEARRLATRFQSRRPDMKAAARFADDTAVMSRGERRILDRLQARSQSEMQSS